MLLAVLSSFHSSIFRVFVKLTIWFLQFSADQTLAITNRHEQHIFRNSCSLLFASYISSFLQKICNKLVFIKTGETEVSVKLLPTPRTLSVPALLTLFVLVHLLNLLYSYFDEWLIIDKRKKKLKILTRTVLSSSTIMTNKTTNLCEHCHPSISLSSIRVFTS